MQILCRTARRPCKLKAYRDIKNSLDTAKEEGLAKGRAVGIASVSKMMYDKGMDIDAIASMTGLDKAEVERLCRQ